MTLLLHIVEKPEVEFAPHITDEPHRPEAPHITDEPPGPEAPHITDEPPGPDAPHITELEKRNCELPHTAGPDHIAEVPHTEDGSLER